MWKTVLNGKRVRQQNKKSGKGAKGLSQERFDGFESSSGQKQKRNGRGSRTATVQEKGCESESTSTFGMWGLSLERRPGRLVPMCERERDGEINLPCVLRQSSPVQSEWKGLVSLVVVLPSPSTRWRRRSWYN
jgi:hypothetical protein